MVVDVESGPAPTEKGSFAKEQDRGEGREKQSQAGDKVILCETGKKENDDQTQNGKEKVDNAVTDQPGQLTQAGNENSETISVNTNQDSRIEVEGDTQGQSNTEESGKANSQKLTETRTDKCQTVADDRNKKLVTVEEAEENSPAEPMEVEATETSATDVSAAFRGEEDTCTGLILTLSYT